MASPHANNLSSFPFHIKDNEGVYCQQRAFNIAGAQKSILEPWNVKNKSSSRLFMKEFCKNCLTKGINIREAFRAPAPAL